MNITGKSLTWMFGVAAGTVVAVLASKTSRNFKKINLQRFARPKTGGRPSKHRYDDSEIYYI